MGDVGVHWAQARATNMSSRGSHSLAYKSSNRRVLFLRPVKDVVPHKVHRKQRLAL